ncbi:MAG: EthD family reductase [Anaerolineales bacterium]|nr:EthD family reductase [Anaerolineales bacterium]
MYKLVILIEPQDHPAEFDAAWPQFLAAAERMPGLRSEVTGRVDRALHGSFQAHLIHELHFDSLTAAGEAMASPEGQQAGQILQQISGGKVTLLLADHLQDDLAGFASDPPQGVPPGDRA